MSALKVFVSIQPSLSHYRAPFIRILLNSANPKISIGGKSNFGGGSAKNTVQTAPPDIVQNAEIFDSYYLGPIVYERGLLKRVWRGTESAYVVEGNIFSIAAWFAPTIARIRKRKIFFWGHGWRQKETGVKRLIRRLFYSKVDGIAVYGNHAKRLGIDQGFPGEHIRVINNSIYTRSFLQESLTRIDGSIISQRAQYQIPEDAYVVISSARLTKRRKVADLITALSQLPDSLKSKIVFLVIGEGEERPLLETQAATSGLDIRFLGAIYDKHVLRDLYEVSNLCAIAGWAGLNVIQSLGFGCPVLVSDDMEQQSPEAEAVVPGETGYHFTHGSMDDLSRVLTALVSGKINPVSRKACVEYTIEHYTAEVHAGRLLQFLREELT